MLAGEEVLAKGGHDSVTRVSASALAEHFSVSTRQINRKISLGMPTSSLANAAFWRANRPSHNVPGILKRPRLDGEVPAKEMATSLQVNLSRVHQLLVVARRHVENFCSRRSGVEEDAF